MNKFVIIFASLIVLIGVFMFLRPSDTPKLPVNTSDGNNVPQDIPGATNIKRFSDVYKNTVSNGTGTGSGGASGGTSGGTGTNNGGIRSQPTSKPLPYPRITINYSVQTVNSIGNINTDRNSTFMIITLDIRNYGYKYFDAFPAKFRLGTNGDILPLMNVSTGKMINAVLPNNSRAKGDIIFTLVKAGNRGKLAYYSTDTSENYYIMYRQEPLSDIEDIAPVVTSNDEG